MRPGIAFEETIDGTKFRVAYSSHFVKRYEIGEPWTGRNPVKNTVTEQKVEEKIREALPQIDDIASGDPDAGGVIVSAKSKFIMIFAVLKEEGGFKLNMVTTSPGLEFKANSPKDYEIQVNPLFQVRFHGNISYALKVSILADIASNGVDLEQGMPVHIVNELMDYWFERNGDHIAIMEADWSSPIHEVVVA